MSQPVSTVADKFVLWILMSWQSWYCGLASKALFQASLSWVRNAKCLLSPFDWFGASNWLIHCKWIEVTTAWLLQQNVYLLQLLCVFENWWRNKMMGGWDGICFFLFLGPILWNYQISAFNLILTLLLMRSQIVPLGRLIIRVLMRDGPEVPMLIDRTSGPALCRRTLW